MNAKSLSFITLIIIVIVGIFYFIKSVNEPKITFTPQQIKLYTIDGSNDTPLNILATTLPQFAVSLKDGKYKNLWEVHAAERERLVATDVANAKGDVTLQAEATFNDDKKQVVLTPKMNNQLKPGLYKLNVKVKTVKGEDITITQDFTWGVLAINTNKGIYSVGEDVKIGMAVLDDFGTTKCIAKEGRVVYGTAKVWLTIKSPTGKMQELSTDDGTIKGSKSCADRSITNDGDFLTQTKAEEEGRYEVHMEAENLFGKRSMDYHFTVKNNTPFEIERNQYPTRIYPKVTYPVSITVKANQDYSGKVTDIVPSNFKIMDISGKGEAKEKKDFQLIEWDVNWQKGQTYTLSYTIKFPLIAPEFYIVGPLHIGDFSEGREWQIASDSLFTTVQEKHATTVTTGTSVSVTLDNAPTQNNLLVLICSRTTSSSFTTPSGWTSSYNNSSGPRIYMYHRIVPASMSQTITCNTITSGVLGIQVIEYSGNSTSASSVRDQRARRNGISCTSGTFASASLTPGNPDVLIISAFSSTTARTVNSHTNSFVDNATSFNGTSGTFDSGWVEAINSPPVATTDTVSYSGNAGTCDNLMVSFNPTITVSQGSFRFFDNADSTTPGSPRAAQNTNIALTVPNDQFRLRMLLDVDSPTSSMALTAGDFILQEAPLPATGNCSDLVSTDLTPVSTSSAIAYFDNPTPDNLNFISSSGNDPSDSGSGYTTVLEDYMELFTDDDPSNDISNNQNAILNNQAGLWDFSLYDNTDGSDHRTYCLKVTDNAGGDLDAYRNYPQVTLYQAEVVIDGGTTIKGGTTIY